MFSRKPIGQLVAHTAGLIALCATLAAADDLPAVSARPPVPPTVIEDAYARGPSVAERLEEIRKRVENSKPYPEIARIRGVSGVVLMGFKIGADGHAREIETIKSSGSGTLDRAAALAVERAGILPWVWGRIVVPIRFELSEAD